MKIIPDDLEDYIEDVHACELMLARYLQKKKVPINLGITAMANLVCSLLSETNKEFSDHAIELIKKRIDRLREYDK